LQAWVCGNLHKEIGLIGPFEISESTSLRWLLRLRMTFDEYRRGSYVDGHERDDVVQYTSEFLKRMVDYEKRMIKFN
jgi:hypothetical protein